MKLFLVVLQFALGFGVFAYMIWPLISSEGDRFPILDDLSEQRRKDKVIEALRDLEYEHETGKINTEDYRDLRDHYLTRAAKLFDDEDLESYSVESVETESELDEDLEKRIAEEREKLN